MTNQERIDGIRESQRLHRLALRMDYQQAGGEYTDETSWKRAAKIVSRTERGQSAEANKVYALGSDLFLKVCAATPAL